jgi:competence protein ComEC
MPSTPPAAPARHPSPRAPARTVAPSGGSAALAGWIAGSAAQLGQPELWDAGRYGLLLAAAGLALAASVAIARRAGNAGSGDAPAGAPRGRGRAAAALLAGAAFAIAAFALCGLRASAFAQDALDPALEGRDIAVVGTVAAMPQRTELGLRWRMDIASARIGDAAVRLPPQVEVAWYARSRFDDAQGEAGGDETGRAQPAVRAGDRWAMTVRFKAPHGARNPGGFDYELWAWDQGIQAVGSVRAGAKHPAPVRLAAGWSHPVERARQAVRDAIVARGAATGDTADPARQRAMGVVAALVTGDQRAIGRDDWELFRATGVAHLVSISGLHITMFAWLAMAVVGRLWRRSTRLCLALPAPHAALAGGVLLAAGYALFSGWGIPSQRTVCMLAVVALLRLSGRRWPWPAVWLLACAAVAAADPWALLQAGFWLSFVAVGVLFASGLGAMHSVAAGGAGMRAGGRFGAYFVGLVREQTVVTLALTPLVLLLFHQVSAVGLLANIVAIPVVTLLVTPLAMLGILAPALWSAAASAVESLASFLQALAGLPGATIAASASPLWAVAAGVAGGLLLAMRLPAGLRALGAALLLPVFLWQPARPAPGRVELLAADIGQGSAVLVRTAGHSLLYDAGPRFGSGSDAGQRVLVPLLQSMGERIDTLVLSHRDTDHTGGAPAVLSMQPQAALLSSIERGHPLQSMRPALRCEAGQRWTWDGVEFAVLHPRAADYAAQPARSSNALSCVLRIRAADGASALLAGDVERGAEAALAVREADALPSDLLLVPHHGSQGASSAGFVAAVQPRIALVQAGWRNSFGHPAPAVVERYRAAGALVVGTAACGAARWRSDRPGAVECERATARRYWQHRAEAP